MPPKPRRVVRELQKSHWNARPDPRNQGWVNDLREFQDDLFCDMEEETERDFRAARFPKLKVCNLKVASAVPGTVSSSSSTKFTIDSGKEPKRKRTLQHAALCSKRSKFLESVSSDKLKSKGRINRKARKKGNGQKLKVKRFLQAPRSITPIGTLKSGAIDEPAHHFEDFVVIDLTDTPSVRVSEKERDIDKLTGVLSRYSITPAEEVSNRHTSLRYPSQTPSNLNVSNVEKHSNCLSPEVLLPIVAHFKAIPKVDVNGEPSGYSSHIQAPRYFIDSDGWWRRAVASADPLITFNLVWEFDRNTDDVEGVIGDNYKAYKAYYNGKNKIHYTTTIGVFSIAHLRNAIRSEFTLNEAESGQHSLEVRDSLITFHYKNDFGTEYAQYVIQEGNPNAWKDIKAAFCLPSIDRNTFTFKFGAQKGWLIS